MKWSMKVGDMKRIGKLDGPRVRIREIRHEEISEILEWIEDPSFRSEFLPFGRDADDTVMEKLKGIALEVGGTRFLAIEKTKIIGLVLYHKVSYFDYFDVGFYVVPNERNKGFGAEAMRLLVDYVFKTYRVDRIEAGTSSLNVASQKALEKAGFRKEAVRRKTLFRNEVWEDSILYSIIR